MRINKFVAQATGMSRRAADRSISDGHVTVNGAPASTGFDVGEHDSVELNEVVLHLPAQVTTIVFNKPVDYIVSRRGQGSATIYELLPLKYHRLKAVGRLDKDSSGLLLLTSDGDLANLLTHPSHKKQKLYQIQLSTPLAPLHRQMISDHGIKLDDGISKFELSRQVDGDDSRWTISMHEGRNRQIRRTFEALGYRVTKLHRTQFGDYHLDGLATGELREV